MRIPQLPTCEGAKIKLERLCQNNSLGIVGLWVLFSYACIFPKFFRYSLFDKCVSYFLYQSGYLIIQLMCFFTF